METLHSAGEAEKLKQSGDMALLYFSGNTCGVCRDMLPKLETLLRKYPAIRAAKAEAQNLPELAAAYGIFSVPAIVLIVRGKETVREAGIISLDGLEENIARYCELLYGNV